MELTVKARSAGSDQSSAVLARWTLYLFAFAAIYALLFCNAIPTFVDEAYSFNLANEKSLRHMFAALRDGADGSFPLYALIVNGWARIFGSSELSLRLNSGLFVFLFVWQSSRRLLKYYHPGIVVLAVLFAISDANFTYYALQARCYGLVIFLFSLCFWSTWDLIQGAAVSNRVRLRHALVCGLLCLAHPLGLVYTAIFGALYLIFSGILKRLSKLNAIAFLGGPALFLPWLPSFLQQRSVNPAYNDGLFVPGPGKYWKFAFFNSIGLFSLCVLGAALIFITRRRTKSWPREAVPGLDMYDEAEQRGNTLLVIYSLAFIVTLNGVMAIFDAARVMPVYWMVAVRYVLVCWVPYCVVVGAILAGFARLSCRKIGSGWSRAAVRIEFYTLLVGLLATMALYWRGWIKDRAKEQSDLLRVSRTAAAKHLTVVCDDYWDAFYLATRTPTDNVVYLLDNDYPFARFLLQAAKYYPHPQPIYPYKSDLGISAQLHSTNAYLFVRRSPREARIVNPGKTQDSGSD